MHSLCNILHGQLNTLQPTEHASDQHPPSTPSEHPRTDAGSQMTKALEEQVVMLFVKFYLIQSLCNFVDGLTMCAHMHKKYPGDSHHRWRLGGVKYFLFPQSTNIRLHTCKIPLSSITLVGEKNKSHIKMGYPSSQ